MIEMVSRNQHIFLFLEDMYDKIIESKDPALECVRRG